MWLGGTALTARALARVSRGQLRYPAVDCPRCRSEQTQSVRMVLATGAGGFSGMALGIGTGGAAVSGFQGTSQTELARSLDPGERPGMGIVGGVGGLLVIAGGLLIFIGTFLSARSCGVEDPESSASVIKDYLWSCSAISRGERTVPRLVATVCPAKTRGLAETRRVCGACLGLSPLRKCLGRTDALNH